MTGAANISTPRAARRPGFTIAELIVAVAAVALLTVGIGQLFSSVGRLVGSGAALAETDQFARAVATQLRDDFESLASMRGDETFVAIRNRVMGDANGNGALDAGERAVYLTADDRQADARDEILPYTAGSRAITVRLDEIMFLGFAGSGGIYSSAQFPAAFTDRPTPSTEVARIYYGHGLRPAPDNFDPDNPPANSNVPVRRWVPDGDFGQRPGEANFFDPTSQVNAGRVVGLNEYAADWPLMRHAMLLYGGLAAGYAPGPNRASQAGAPFDESLVYAPYIRDFEALPAARGPFWGFTDANITFGPLPRVNAYNGPPYARLVRHGRVDLCAQSPEDVRRWLEGLDPATVPPAEWGDASAFGTGRFDDAASAGTPRWEVTDGFPSTKVDAPLWRRADPTVGDDTDQAENMRRLRSAIAGCFTRLQTETAPRLFDRNDVVFDSAGTPANLSSVDPPTSALMDSAFTIGSRVTSFEIAWSDGKTWLSSTPLDRNNDGDTNDADDLREDDLIWYDIDFARFASPTNPDLTDFGAGNLYGTASDDADTDPETTRGQRNNTLYTPSNAAPGVPVYDPRETFGQVDSPAADGAGDFEYLAVFPFRTPDSSSGYSLGIYQKPTRIRVRMTVLDAQSRLGTRSGREAAQGEPGGGSQSIRDAQARQQKGRQYEFQFSISPN
ncbi:MAG: hypothetical protein SFZ24_01895 [Planctomycetota bacterium]|nr:hypothetical protein [Planctomycetota bacterium]